MMKKVRTENYKNKLNQCIFSILKIGSATYIMSTHTTHSMKHSHLRYTYFTLVLVLYHPTLTQPHKTNL